jgi:hypothetical protein
MHSGGVCAAFLGLTTHPCDAHNLARLALAAAGSGGGQRRRQRAGKSPDVHENADCCTHPTIAQSLARLAAAAAGAGGGELAPDAEAALRRLADGWLDAALAAACGAARRRKAEQLTADDAVTYLERTWCARLRARSRGTHPCH